MPTDLLDDEYVANLLKQDAKNATKSYQLVGIDAFNPNRLRAAAPKPNTNFLRHIIRQTDSHNAALLAKEAEESRARLKQMDKTKNREERRIKQRKSRKAEGRLTPISSDGETEDGRSRKRKDYSSEDDAKADSRRRRRHREEPRDARSRRDRSRSRDRHKEPRLRDVDEDTHSKARHSRRRHRERRRGHRSEDENTRPYPNDESKHRRSRKRSRTRSASPRRSPSPRSSKHHRKSRYRSRSRSPKRVSKYHDRLRNKDEKADGQKRSKRRSASLPSDSDPLEAIVGPLPPTAQPTVRSRGRGAHKANSMGMDARFSSTYDPAVDIGLQSDEEDTWGDALEAVQDRQRWKKQGAERLKAAGFTNEQVEKWENGDEKTEDDVVWAMKGEAREWDRGKVVDQDGDVDLKAEWGRLK